VSSDWFPLRCWWNHPSMPPCEKCEHCLANDEVERLRAAGDALAEVADEWPELVEAWQEARRER
jgi:hypothetical protein